jgi:hypothetical protein
MFTRKGNKEIPKATVISLCHFDFRANHTFFSSPQVVSNFTNADEGIEMNDN